MAPLKLISLPRLELCAALLLAKLYEGTIRALHQTSFQNIIFWSDSIITLHWINTLAHTLKTFIANRVVQIQQLTDPKQWRHVPSQDNPADLVSRGMTPAEFVKNNIWFDGPSWLKDNEVRWPNTAIQIPDDIPERRPGTTLTATIAKNNLLNTYSSFTKLKRIIAHCIRFINNARRQTVSAGHITTTEMQNASKRITSIVQAEDFAKEIAQLKSREHVKGRLALLNPFLDVDGIIRVGGRLLNAELPYSQKHPAILPRKHYVTTLIIREEHLRHFHAGAEATLNAIRKNYWIIDGRSTVKNILHQCIRCRRAQPLLFQPIMGNLPKARVSYKRPFLQAGIDYCGPFFIKERKHRNRTKIKVYAAIFICLATRAIHIEIVSDLTTEAFLASLRRFFARRGKCTDIYTDNATNFVGAKLEIRQIQELLSSTRHNDEVTRRLTDESINWHLIPPRSPHFGGSWEAAVKSFKRHMIRTVGNTLLTFEALTTYATEVEAILNSRPLIPLSSDPNDLQALTPAHFLIGDSLTGMPEQDLSDVPSGRLSSWQHVQKLRQHFWKRWKHEYLHELTVRRKWHSEAAAEVKIGTLVVLKEDRVPPIRWNLARVIDVHPGGDGVVRVATVKTISGIYKRDVRNLSPLLLDDC